MRRKPAVVKGVPGLAHFCQHVLEIQVNESWQHEAIMQLGAPARGRGPIRRFPEARNQGTQQQLLCAAHVRVGWHLERAQFQQAQATSGRVGRVHLVDRDLAAVRVAGGVNQDVAQGAVDQPGRHALTVQLAVFVDLFDRNFKFVQLVVAGLIHAGRLAGGANEHATEQITQ